MADSIAKLAVVITGDAGPLAQATNRASNIVRGFGNDFTHVGQKARSLDVATQSTVKLSTALSAARGNLGAAFTVGGPALLAITAMTAGVLKLASAGDTLLQKIGADKLETWAGQWERVNEQLGIMGMRFTLIAREASSDFADMLSGVNQALFPDAVAHVNAIKAREAAEKKMADDKERAAEAAKKQAQANKEAAEAQQKERDALLEMKFAQRDRADQIRDSVATPAEELRKTFVELRSLLASGFLDEESAMRAAKAAQMKFDADKPRKDFRSEGVAAADKFSMAGFSAVQGGLREIDRLERVQKESLKEEQRQTGIQKEIRDILHGQQPVVLMEGEP